MRLVRQPFIQLTLLLALTGLLISSSAHSLARPQDQDTSEEIVANLAAGRVLIAVFKDGIAVGTIENKIESSSEVPLIVPMNSERVGVLLGAVDWFSPSTRTSIADLPRELPHLRYHPAYAATSENKPDAPHLIQPPSNEATAADIEQTSLGVMSRLSEVSSNIHGHVDVKPDEPLTELVLVDYLEAYGPEAWLMTYHIDQQPERGDFWVTQVKRPRYNQLWPPDKTAPHVLLEIDYPQIPEKSALLSLLASNSPQLASVRSSAAMSASCDALTSNPLNLKTSDLALPCLRSAMDALASATSAKEILALISPEGSIRWIIAPPPDTRPKMKPAQPPPDENAPTLQRPTDAPALNKPTKPN